MRKRELWSHVKTVAKEMGIEPLNAKSIRELSEPDAQKFLSAIQNPENLIS
jgi:energy-coupling factor transporter ATP-binding protein EcfA2